MVAITSPRCLGCGGFATFVMTDEQLIQWKSGGHAQDVFPAWSIEDREQLISGTCPPCWEEMFPEEEEEDEEYIDEYDDGDYFFYDGDFAIDPESSFYNYESDWYVD